MAHWTLKDLRAAGFREPSDLERFVEERALQFLKNSRLNYKQIKEAMFIVLQIQKLRTGLLRTELEYMKAVIIGVTGYLAVKMGAQDQGDEAGLLPLDKIKPFIAEMMHHVLGGRDGATLRQGSEQAPAASEKGKSAPRR